MTSTFEVLISILRTFLTFCDLFVFTLYASDFYSISAAFLCNEFLYCFGRSFNASMMSPSPIFGFLVFSELGIFYAVFDYDFFTSAFDDSFYFFIAALFLMIVPRLALLDLNKISSTVYCFTYSPFQCIPSFFFRLMAYYRLAKFILQSNYA